MAIYASTGHKVTTVPIFISAINFYSTRARLGELPRGTRFQQMLTGIRNYFGNDSASVPKTALSMEDLLAFQPHVDRASFEGARDWCACLFAFFGLLRVNEYMNGGLQRRDVRLTTWGVSITIKFSKTSLTSDTVDIARRSDILCPSTAFATYLSSFRLHPSLPQRPTDPLFLSRSQPGSPFIAMTDEEFIGRVRSLIRLARPGFEPSAYAGHSFRRGGASALILAGVSDALIQQHGRWKSDAWKRYVDTHNILAVRLIPTQALSMQSCSRA